MDLFIEQKQFLDIKGIAHLIDHEIIDNSFVMDEQIILGTINLKIVYFSLITNASESETRTINYQILSTQDKMVREVNINHLNLNVIDNQGIDIGIELGVNVEKINEIIKEEYVKEVQEVLSTALQRNIEESIFPEIEESYSTTRIIFTKSEADVNRICEQYNKTLSEIYESNNYSLDNRIIINIDEF